MSQSQKSALMAMTSNENQSETSIRRSNAGTVMTISSITYKADETHPDMQTHSVIFEDEGESNVNEEESFLRKSKFTDSRMNGDS